MILFVQLLSLFLLIAGNPRMETHAPRTAEDKAYGRLVLMSSEKLNISTLQPDDSLINLARRVETLARQSGNIAREFKAGQIIANAHGLSGNFGLAANKAQQLLEAAMERQDKLAIGLALQAIGDTYMHTDRLAQADSLFTEATRSILHQGDIPMQVQQLLQHLKIHIERNDTLHTRNTIHRIRGLLTTSRTLPGADIYAFLVDCREMLYAIAIGDLDLASELLSKVQAEKPANGMFDLWVNYIATQYYAVQNDNEKALAYSDSTLIAARLSTNRTTLRHYKLKKIALLEKIGRDDEACELYREVAQITDSVYRTQYTAQIDSLHATYRTDLLQVSNYVRRNEFYSKAIFGLVGIILIAVVSGIFIRRKNRELIESRYKLKTLQAATADSLHAKSLFLSNMSHELRTPLNAIVGFSTILTEDGELDEETRLQCSAYIRQNGELLQKLINDVIDFSKLQNKTLRFTAAPCEVTELCRNVLKTVDKIKRTEAEMHFETDLEQVTFTTDASRLQQVLINLLVNATKFTPSGSITLTLHIDAKRDEAVFAVEDTGCGIPSEKQGRIFERFEKLHEGIQGAGLGLSICKLIVDHTGGRIWIDPNYTLGARFVFTHPLHFNPNTPKV